MTEKQKNDVLYVCSLIETIARKTKNHRQDVIRHFTKAGIERQLRLAEVNHCLSFEQVSDELIEDLNIPDGDFDTAAECRYTVPSATSIGMLYQGLVLSTMKDEDAAQAILDVFSSFITDEISDFNSNVYYTNPDYLRCSYLEGKMLAWERIVIMAKNQHNAGLHYRPLNQLGLSNFNDYIENPIDSRFKFNPPPLKCGKLFGLCKADRQKEKLQKHCPWHPLLKMKAFTLEINGEAEYIWYCKECDCYYMNPFWRNGEKRILDVYHKVPVRRLIKTAI